MWLMGLATVFTGAVVLLACVPTTAKPNAEEKVYPVAKSEAEWKKQLTPEQFRILRRKGTERAFTGQYWDEKRSGVYRCAGCNQPLFHAEHKFRSGTGWPSYYKAIAPDRVETEVDRGFGMVRTEILCSKCGGHLGHVFRDGPKPTGLRYCVNSASLVFEADDKATDTSIQAKKRVAP